MRISTEGARTVWSFCSRRGRGKLQSGEGTNSSIQTAAAQMVKLAAVQHPRHPQVRCSGWHVPIPSSEPAASFKSQTSNGRHEAAAAPALKASPAQQCQPSSSRTQTRTAGPP